MRMASSLFSKYAVALSSVMMFTSSAFAVTDDYLYTYSTSSTDAGFLGPLMASMGVGFYIVTCCLCLISLVFLALNIWMIIDVLKRTEAELPSKTMWMVLLIVGLLLGFGGIPALVYFFGPRKSLNPTK